MPARNHTRSSDLSPTRSDRRRGSVTVALFWLLAVCCLAVLTAVIVSDRLGWDLPLLPGGPHEPPAPAGEVQQPDGGDDPVPLPPDDTLPPVDSGADNSIPPTEGDSSDDADQQPADSDDDPAGSDGARPADDPADGTDSVGDGHPDGPGAPDASSEGTEPPQPHPSRDGRDTRELPDVTVGN